MPDMKSFDGKNVWNVPTEVGEKQYHGCGYALVAIKDDKIAAIQYLEDLDPKWYMDDDLLAELGLTESRWLKQVVNDLKVGQAANFLNEIGNVHLGMMSSWQFVEL